MTLHVTPCRLLTAKTVEQAMQRQVLGVEFSDDQLWTLASKRKGHAEGSDCAHDLEAE
jgi:hypothetical protein